MANYARYQEYFKTFLGGWTFEDGDKTLTIKSVGEEEMYDADTGGKKKALALRFEELELPMVLNVTNSETIAAVVGSDRLADWIGHKIIVGTSKVKAFGKVHDAIRVRSDKPDETLYTCEECGKIIKPAAGKQPSELAEISKRNCGRVLCVACMRKAKEDMSNG
jgi:hypothetical protein